MDLDQAMDRLKVAIEQHAARHAAEQATRPPPGDVMGFPVVVAADDVGPGEPPFRFGSLDQYVIREVI